MCTMGSGGIVAALGLVLATGPAKEKTLAQAWGSGAVHLDTRRQTSATLNLGVSGEHFDYFGFVDLWSPSWAEHPAPGWSFLTEQGVFARLGQSSLSLGGQVALASQFSALRLGPRWTISRSSFVQRHCSRWGLVLQVDAFALVTGDVTQRPPQSQVSAFYSWTPNRPALQQRLNLSGFADVNFVWGPGRPTAAVVTEHQVAFSLHSHLRLVAEFRYDAFRIGDSLGLGLGLEAQLPF